MKNFNDFKVDESRRESPRAHESFRPNEIDSLNSRRLSVWVVPGLTLWGSYKKKRILNLDLIHKLQVQDAVPHRSGYRNFIHFEGPGETHLSRHPYGMDSHFEAVLSPNAVGMVWIEIWHQRAEKPYWRAGLSGGGKRATSGAVGMVTGPRWSLHLLSGWGTCGASLYVIEKKNCLYI